MNYRLWATCLAFSLAATAQAQEQTAVVSQSTCEVVAKSGSAAGAIGGAAVGEIAGSFLGEALFGRSGRGLGSLLGGGAGASIGENAFANNTYRCVLTVVNAKGETLYLESLSNKPKNVGQTIILVRKSEGDYIIR